MTNSIYFYTLSLHPHATFLHFLSINFIKCTNKRCVHRSSSTKKIQIQTRHFGFLNETVLTQILNFFIPCQILLFYKINKRIQIFYCVFLTTVSLSDVTAHITPTSLTSPVSTAAKISISAAKTATSEPDVAFPAVLKGSKQRVPPPVPPRGSPKPKRGGANSQSSVDTKGDYLNISVNDIPPQTPITSSDDDFVFYGHDFKFKDPVACSMPIAVSDHSVKITKLVASNSFLDFVEEADSITERSHPGKDLIAQTTMMAKFNIDKAVREHLDSGDYDDTSLTDSSSEDIVIHELKDVIEEKDVGRQSKSPKQFIKGVVTQIGDKFARKSPNGDNSSSDRISVHNVKSSDLISAAKSLKKTNKSENNQNELEKEVTESKSNKNAAKPGLITSLSKKLNFNQSKRDKNRVQDKRPRPKVEIKTYSEEHSRGMTKDEVICHRKAKNKIDMFQKHIWKVQSDSESSSRRSSISSSQGSQKSVRPDLSRRVLVKETKKLFEPIEYTHGSSSSIDKKHYSLNTTEMKAQVAKSISGNVHEKIKKFSEPTTSDMPKKIPRQKRRSFKKKSEKKKVYKMRKDVEEVL